MIRSLALGGALSLLMAASAGAQPTPPPAGPALPTPDYLVAAGQSDQFEVQEGRLAQSQGKSTKVKDFGRQMVAEHTKSTDMIKASAMKSGLSVTPPPLRPDQQSNIDSLRALGGAEFDAAYIQQQAAAHQEALQVHSAYAQGGDDKNLVGTAKLIVPVVQSHMAMLNTMGAK